MSLDDVFEVKKLELKTLGTTLGDDMLKDLVLNPMLRGYIEEIDGNIAGYLSLSYDGDIIEIYNLCVDERYRRRHIASNLLLHAFETLDAKSSILEVRASNMRALALYFKLVFTVRIPAMRLPEPTEEKVIIKMRMQSF